MNAFERVVFDLYGVDPRWVRRRLPAALADAGLRQVGLAVSMQYVGDGGACERHWRVFFGQLAPVLTGAGLLTEADLEAGLAMFRRPLLRGRARRDLLRLGAAHRGDGRWPDG